MDKLIYATVLVLVIAAGAYYAYTTHVARIESEALAVLYASIDAITVYEQKVVTELSVSDRSMRVTGTYRNDRANSTYSSFATTTLSVPGGESFSFSLSNVVSGDDIRFKLERVSGTLTSAAPMGPTWYTFTKSTIPKEFQGIAVPGPILDTLALFRSGGSALFLLRSIKNDTTFGEPLTRFEYSMAPIIGVEEPPVSSVRDRLGSDGLVTVWTDPNITGVQYVVLSAPGYVSTTTITSVHPLAQEIQPE